jgi:hypothetical protein
MNRGFKKEVSNEIEIINILKSADDNTTKKEDYQIAISQDGKFVVTFDTGKNKFVIKIIFNIKHT